MTTYVAFKTKESFRQKADILLENLEKGVSTSQASLAVEMANEMVDLLMKAFIDDMIASVEVKPMTEKVMKQLGSIVRKTAHTLIDKVVKKLKNDELLELTHYINGMRLEHNGDLYLAFPLSELRATTFAECFEKIDNGEGDSVRNHYAESIEEMASLALMYYYKEPMSRIKLGMILRKVVDVGYVTIDKGISMAMGKVFKNQELEEMAEMSKYLKTLIIKP